MSFHARDSELDVFLCLMVASPAAIAFAIEAVVIGPDIDLCEALGGFELRICGELSRSIPIAKLSSAEAMDPANCCQVG